MTLVALAMLLIPPFWSGLGRLSVRSMLVFLGIGVLVALHWLTFYGAVKLANASVAATCMALAPVLTALVEPRIVGRRFEPSEILFGLAVTPGVALVVGGTPPSMHGGIALGIVSVAFVAVFSSLTEKFVGGGSPLAMTGLALAAGAVVLALVGLVGSSEAMFVLPERPDLGLLLVLALGCTLLPFALALVALGQLSAFTTTLAVNLEPVYAILLAIVLLGEQRELGTLFYVGVTIIMAAVFTHSIRDRRARAAEEGILPPPAHMPAQPGAPALHRTGGQPAADPPAASLPSDRTEPRSPGSR
jgi:drug/metabolite transporter (DMT)-like permease